MDETLQVLALVIKAQDKRIESLEEVLKTIKSMQFDKNNEENVITKMIDKILKP